MSSSGGPAHDANVIPDARAHINQSTDSAQDSCSESTRNTVNAHDRSHQSVAPAEESPLTFDHSNTVPNGMDQTEQERIETFCKKRLLKLQGMVPSKRILVYPNGQETEELTIKVGKIQAANPVEDVYAYLEIENNYKLTLWVIGVSGKLVPIDKARAVNMRWDPELQLLRGTGFYHKDNEDANRLLCMWLAMKLQEMGHITNLPDKVKTSKSYLDWFDVALITVTRIEKEAHEKAIKYKRPGGQSKRLEPIKNPEQKTPEKGKQTRRKNVVSEAEHDITQSAMNESSRGIKRDAPSSFDEDLSGTDRAPKRTLHSCSQEDYKAKYEQQVKKTEAQLKKTKAQVKKTQAQVKENEKIQKEKEKIQEKNEKIQKELDATNQQLEKLLQSAQVLSLQTANDQHGDPQHQLEAAQMEDRYTELPAQKNHDNLKNLYTAREQRELPQIDCHESIGNVNKDCGDAPKNLRPKSKTDQDTL